MNPQLTLTSCLHADEFEDIKREMVISHGKWDFQSDDHCVLADFAIVLDAQELRRLFQFAERLSMEATAAEREMLECPAAQGELNLPTRIRAAIGRQGSAGFARVMRFDFHPCANGWMISEVNSDVPGGYIEASAFNALMASASSGLSAPPDAADAYVQAIVSGVGAGSRIALVHATAYTEDRQVMLFLGKRLAERGARCVLLGPDQLRWNKGRAQDIWGNSIDGVVRFFPAEWLPSIAGTRHWRAYFSASETRVSNPATAVLVQSKRFPLAWRALRSSLETWRTFLPETRGAEECDVASLDTDEWVIKPAFGRVGDGIAMRGVTPENDYLEVKRAVNRNPREWVYQRRFRAIPVASGDSEFYPTVGVYTIDGIASGAYGRIARKPLIDHEAQDVAVLVAAGGRA